MPILPRAGSAPQARTGVRCRRICRESRWSDIQNHACPCCRNGLRRIGEDVGERLDIVPAQLRVIVVSRPKYACRACEDVVVQAPAPARLIEVSYRWAGRSSFSKKSRKAGLHKTAS